MDNHEGEEDQHSRDQIHQHLQHQDDDVKGKQSWIVKFTEKKSCKFNRALKQVREPDSDDRNRDRYEGEDYGEDSPRHKIVDVFKRKNIGKTVV